MQNTGNISWNFLQRFWLFLLFSYLILAPIPAVLLTQTFADLFFDQSGWISENTGSGDKMRDYVEWLVRGIILLPITLVLVFSIRRQSWLNYIYKLLLIAVRYYLAWAMFTYGFSKVFYQQFGETSLYTLDSKAGMLTPMGLAWTFIGHSKAYTIFTGFLEVLAGVLLLWRRTSLLGGMICFAVMFNVMLMNFCYDIPVKIFSMHLVFWSLVLIFSQGKRLLNLFVFNKPAEPADLAPYFNRLALRITTVVVKCGFILIVLSSLYIYTEREEAGNDPLRGIYYTVSHLQNGKKIESNDTLYWKKLIIEKSPLAVLYREGIKPERLELVTDSLKKNILVNPDKFPEKTHAWKCSLKDSILTIRGTWNKDSIEVMLKQFDHNSFRLNKRGFHWVNEYPYNR